MTSNFTPQEEALRYQSKNHLRQLMLSLRNQLPSEIIEERSKRIVNQIKSLNVWPDLKTIAAFYPLHHEVDLRHLFEIENKTIALPITQENNLVFKKYTSESELEKGQFGVKEPNQHSPIINSNQIDLMLIPAIAADPKGYRIGYGKGYYDRYLELNSPKLKIIVAFQFQLMDEIPITNNDQKADFVITDENIYQL